MSDAYTTPLPGERPLFVETLQLVYWVLFKPRTIRDYLARVEPGFPGNAPTGSAWRVSAWQWERLKTATTARRLVFEGLIASTVVPAMVVAIVLLRESWSVQSLVLWGFVWGGVWAVAAGGRRGRRRRRSDRHH